MALSNVRPTINSAHLSEIGNMVFEEMFEGTDINRGVWDSGYYNPDYPIKNYDCNTYVDGKGVTRSVLRIWPEIDQSLNNGAYSITPNGFFRRDITTGNPGFRQLYGYFEASCKGCIGIGTFPAWWLFNGGNKNEFDIMEMWPGGDGTHGDYGWGDGNGHPINYSATTWLGPNSQVNQTKMDSKFPQIDLSLDFHKYGLFWSPTTIAYFFDDQLLVEFANPGFSSEIFLYLDLWFSNTTPTANNPTPRGTSGIPTSSLTPQGSSNSFEVDYVRTWLLTSGGSASGPAATGSSGTTSGTGGSTGGSTGGTTGGSTGGTTGGATGSTNQLPGTALPMAGVPSLGAMTFQDEFNSGFDSTKWNRALWYATDTPTPNFDVGNSCLRIWPTAEFDPRTIDTDGKFEQRYGYFEAKIKLNDGKGVWPAFWLYQHIDNPDGTSYRPEIDIMEAYPGGGPTKNWSTSGLQPNNYGMALHKANGDYSYHVVAYGKTMADYLPLELLDDKFHKYGVYWSKDYIQFFFDDAPIGPQIINDYWNWPMYMLLDLWYGSYSGTPDSTTPLGVGNAFQVEYIRAWALADGTTSVITNLAAPTSSTEGALVPAGGTGGTGSTGGTTGTPSATYSAGDILTVRYNKDTVEWLKNGTVVYRKQGEQPLQTLFFDSSFYTPGGKLEQISFGKVGVVDWSSITGAGKPQDGATVGATLGVDVAGQITPLLAPTLISPKAIVNDLIGDYIQSDNYVPGVTGWRIDKAGNLEANNGIFRGVLAANIVTADTIVSRSATYFEQVSINIADSTTVPITMVMDHAGSFSIILIGHFNVSTANIATDSAYMDISIDASGVKETYQGSYPPASMSTMLGGTLIAGVHTIYIRMKHSGAIGNHLADLEIMRSYR